MPQYSPRTGETVRAFHPRMLGVIKTGRAVKTGSKYARIDFGELLGGVLRVPLTHVVGPED